jgi:RNA polymerase sigma factor (TIGR02999 family)
MATVNDVTELLASSRDGSAEATQQLLSAVYEQLRQMAHAQRARHRDHETLNTTALVHEAYVKLVDGERLPFDGRNHFFAAAARAMRQVLVDAARAAQRDKRGGGIRPAQLDAVAEPAGPESSERLLALDEALQRFAQVDERAARVVECRYFAGLTNEETAEALGLSTATVKRDWAAARAWLYRALDESGAR